VANRREDTSHVRDATPCLLPRRRLSATCAAHWGLGKGKARARDPSPAAHSAALACRRSARPRLLACPRQDGRDTPAHFSAAPARTSPCVNVDRRPVPGDAGPAGARAESRGLLASLTAIHSCSYTEACRYLGPLCVANSRMCLSSYRAWTLDRDNRYRTLLQIVY
jgi:hypothetical protein